MSKSCKNDPTKKYNGTEPSPKGLGYCAHAEKINAKKKGKDGNLWTVKVINNGTKRWVKINSNQQNTLPLNGYKKYFIHFNGGMPYLVYIKNNDVYIYEGGSRMEDLMEYNKLVKHICALKVFIGKSPKIKFTRNSGGYGKEYDGNTILLQIGKYKYMLIAVEIKTFVTKNDTITHFVSPMGNNDYPYPVAIGNKYIYSFDITYGYLDKKYIKQCTLDGILDMIFEYYPFFTPLDSHKNPHITADEFDEIRNMLLNDISLTTIKELAAMFRVTTSGSKKVLVDRIENMRNVVVYRKL